MGTGAGKGEAVDYLQAVERQEKEKQKGRRGKKPAGFEPFKDSVVPDGGVDYLAVSRKWEQYLDRDESEVIHVKQQE